MVVVHDLEYGKRDFHAFEISPVLLFLQSVEFTPTHTFSSWGDADVPLDRRCVVVGNVPPSESKICNLA